jgi:hypothetical protein
MKALSKIIPMLLPIFIWINATIAMEFQDQQPKFIKEFETSENQQNLTFAKEIFSTLDKLNLSNKNLDDAFLDNFATQILKNHQEVEELYLSKNRISDRGLKTLIEVLPTTQRLAVLDLADNCISDDGIEALSYYLAASNVRYSINVCNNPITERGLHIIKAGSDLKSGSKIWFSWNSLLKGNSRSEESSLSVSQLNLLNFFTKNCTHLNLHKEKLDDVSLKNFSMGIEEAKFLTVLNLEKNMIGDKGLIALVQFFLPKANNLKALHLNSNDIGDEGITELSKYIESQYSLLEFITLLDNPFGKKSFEMLRHLMQIKKRMHISFSYSAFLKNIFDSPADANTSNAATVNMNTVPRQPGNDCAINSVGKGGKTALHHAVANRSLDIVKLLIECKANVNQKDEVGYSPLFGAVLTTGPLSAKIIMELRKAGADVNMYDPLNNDTPLIYAAKNRCLENVKALTQTLI